MASAGGPRGQKKQPLRCILYALPLMSLVGLTRIKSKPCVPPPSHCTPMPHPAEVATHYNSVHAMTVMFLGCFKGRPPPPFNLSFLLLHVFCSVNAPPARPPARSPARPPARPPAIPGSGGELFPPLLAQPPPARRLPAAVCHSRAKGRWRFISSPYFFGMLSFSVATKNNMPHLKRPPLQFLGGSCACSNRDPQVTPVGRHGSKGAAPAGPGLGPGASSGALSFYSTADFERWRRGGSNGSGWSDGSGGPDGSGGSDGSGWSDGSGGSNGSGGPDGSGWSDGPSGSGDSSTGAAGLPPGKWRVKYYKGLGTSTAAEAKVNLSLFFLNLAAISIFIILYFFLIYGGIWGGRIKSLATVLV